MHFFHEQWKYWTTILHEIQVEILSTTDFRTNARGLNIWIYLIISNVEEYEFTMKDAFAANTHVCLFLLSYKRRHNTTRSNNIHRIWVSM